VLSPTILFCSKSPAISKELELLHGGIGHYQTIECACSCTDEEEANDVASSYEKTFIVAEETHSHQPQMVFYKAEITSFRRDGTRLLFEMRLHLPIDWKGNSVTVPIFGS